MADIDWSLGYSARYYMTVLDKDTLKDLDKIEIYGGTIKRSLTEICESADVDCLNYDNKEEKIIRIWLDTKQNGASSHIPLFTGLAACPTDKYSGRTKTNSLECYSMLKIAQDVMLPRGWYAPVEASSKALIEDLLSVIGVEINVDPSAPAIKQSIIAEQGETRLSMVYKIIAAMTDWRLRLDGYGSIYIEPIDKTSKITFGSSENDVIETDISITYDWYSAPNVLRCTLDDSYAEARDERDDSPLSIQNRGREVWYEDTDVQLNKNETLAEYTQRMLKKYQETATTVSYTRRYFPDIYLNDYIRLNYPAQNISGLYKIKEQSIALGHNARTSEEVTKA